VVKQKNADNILSVQAEQFNNPLDFAAVKIAGAVHLTMKRGWINAYRLCDFVQA
jgi:hypothetical protein